MVSRRRDGFTLIELMVTVIIVAILATVAVVSYKKYAARARTQEAIGFLMEIKMKQETYFTTYDQYVSSDPGGETMYPAGDITDNALLPWDVDCTAPVAATAGWCSLGVRAGFGACESGVTSASGQCTHHQFYTRGWAPGANAASIPADRINNPNRRWWYALAAGDVDANGETSLWFLSSEITEVYNKAEGDEI
jgi:prepilin-type N-terminal cleavage/methylation domain-containing protein